MKAKEFLILVKLKRADSCKGCPCLQINIGGSLNECNLGHSDIHPPCSEAQHGKIAHGWERPQSCINAIKYSKVIQFGIIS